MTVRIARQVFLLGAVTFALAACGSDSTVATSTTSSTAKPGSTTSTSIVSRGPTAWSDLTSEWKSRAPRPFAEGPDSVAEDLAAAWRGSDTSEVGQITVAAVLSGEPLVIELRETGGADATVASADVEITLEGGDEGWVVVSARARDTCVTQVDPADPTHCA